jgi:DNA-binding IclR family transcriptional regulator
LTLRFRQLLIGPYIGTIESDYRTSAARETPLSAQKFSSESGERSEFSLSVSRALQILSLFNSERPSLGVSEISRALSLSKTSTLRFLQALEMHGYLERDAELRKYHPGIEAARVGSLYVGGSRLRRIALPILERLAADHGFTAYLTVLQNDRMVILASVEAEGRLKFSIPIGAKLPVHSTATGQAALSTLEIDEVEAIVRRAGMPARTPRTITTLPALKKVLKEVRARGYSMIWETQSHGTGSVAAPVLRPNAKVVTVLSLGFATSQVTREELPALGEAICKAAATLALLSTQEGQKDAA